MSDVPPTGHPVLPPTPQPAPQPTPQPAPQPTAAPTPRPSLRERAWGLRAVVAVALASVILGGAGGVALASAGDGQDQRSGGPGRGQFGRGPGGAPGGAPGGFRGAPGQGGLGQQQP